MNQTQQLPTAADQSVQQSLAESPPAAEPISESELLGIMRKHCQKSWQATRWLLECKWPERYGKQKGKTAAGPNIDQVLDAVIGVLADEIADETARGRIEARLDHLAAQGFNAAAPQATGHDSIREEAKQDDADQQVDEQFDEPHDEQSDELFNDPVDPPTDGLGASAVSQQAAQADSPEPNSSPIRQAPSAALLKKPARASPSVRKHQRQQADASKRRRKERDRDRKKQRKMRSTARKLKKCRRRPR